MNNTPELVAAVAIVVILFGLTIFQVLLIVGKPLGKYAWGGQHEVLPIQLRIASVTSILIYVLIAFVMMTRAGLIGDRSEGVDNMAWGITVYFLAGIALNALSRSVDERRVMTPLVTLLAVLSFLIVS